MQISLPAAIEHLLHTYGGLTDGQLLDRFVTSRDEESFAALVRRHGPMVMSVCRRILGNVHDAEDAFQASFLILARKAATVVRRGAVGSWLHAVACHAALEAARANGRRRAREKDVKEMPERGVAPIVVIDWRPLLDQELNRLSEKYRAAVVLCDLEGKSRKDAAAALGVGEGTLASRLARARALLARRLTSRGVSLSGAALAVLVAAESASAQVSSALVISTARVAALAATGQAALAGAISAQVVLLMEGVMKTMLLSKLKTVGLLTLVLSLVAGIVGLPPLCGLLASKADARAEPSAPVVGANRASNDSRGSGFAVPAPTNEADQKAVGSGKPETKKFDVADFTSLSISSAFKIEVTRADKFAVSVTADDNLLDLIKVEKKDATLHISLAEKKSLEVTSPMHVVIAMPALKAVMLDGACSCTLMGFESNGEFSARVNGASLLGGSIKAKSVKLEASGASIVKLQGSAKDATLSGTGACAFPLKDFTLDRADVHLTGASQAEVHTSSMLDYHLSGASNLKYHGDPVIGKKEASGVSSVTHVKGDK
jgi:RNA polymerase sigma factor (sigma-70 family)